MVAGIAPPTARDAVDCGRLPLRLRARRLGNLRRGRAARNVVPAKLLTSQLHPGGAPTRCAGVSAIATLAPPAPRLVL
eukprot:2830909-Alexandrium_andersonii.AAC.1